MSFNDSKMFEDKLEHGAIWEHALSEVTVSIEQGRYCDPLNEDRDEGLVGMSHEYSFFNKSGHDVTKIGIDNVPFLLPAGRQYDDHILIRVKTYLSSGVVQELRRHFSRNGKKGGPGYEAFREKFLTTSRNDRGVSAPPAITLTQDIKIRIKDLKENNNNLFLPSVNVLLSLDEVPPLHPHSEEAQALRLGNIVPEAAGVYCFLVDNARKLTPKYVRLGSRWLHVTPTQLTAYRDGLYIFSSDSYNCVDQTSGKQFEYYSVENIDGLDFVHNRIEDVRGTPIEEKLLDIRGKEQDRLIRAENHKQDMDRREQEHRHKEESLRRTITYEETSIKNKLESESVSLKTTIFENELKRQRAYDTDVLERSSSGRKNFTESLKLVGPILTAAIGIGAFLWKLIN